MIRKPEIDTLRSIGIILIIACHLHYFINSGQFPEAFKLFTFWSAKIGLNIFFFVSGASLYYRNPAQFSTIGACMFYQKRFIRLFPLFILLLFIMHIMESQLNIPINTIKSIEGSHWFIWTILIYYIIYPILIYKDKIAYLLGAAIVIYTIGFILYLLFKFLSVDFIFQIFSINFFNYFWTFIAGIFAIKTKPKIKYIGIIAIIIIIPLLILRFYIHNTTLIYVLNSEIASFALLPICLGLFYKLMGQYCPMSRKIADASYAVYLFHLLVFYFAMQFINSLSIRAPLDTICIILFGTLLSLAVGNYLQIIESKTRKLCSCAVLNKLSII